MKKPMAILLLLPCMVLSACSAAPHGADTSTKEEAAGSDTYVEETTPETEAQTGSDTESVSQTTPAETETTPAEIFYVRTPAQPPEKTEITYTVYEFDSYERAVAKANHPYLAATGYAVYSAEGAFLYGVNNEYVTNMMYRAKYIADFAKENGYVYGSAARNPAYTFHTYLTHGRLNEKVVSCDRYVGWVLYEMGLTDQPTDAGMFVWGNADNRDHNLMIFLEKHNYERIDAPTEFRAGDIVFVQPTQSSGGEPFGAHVFICAGNARQDGQYYRYDHGSDARIQGALPSSEGISALFCVYRPTQTTMEGVTPAS